MKYTVEIDPETIVRDVLLEDYNRLIEDAKALEGSKSKIDKQDRADHLRNAKAIRESLRYYMVHQDWISKFEKR
jgi:hypothetical protein